MVIALHEEAAWQAGFNEGLKQPKRPPSVPTMALRNDSQDRLDDVAVMDVTMFRAEMMTGRELWLCCYFANGERVAFNVWATKKGKLKFTVGDKPSEWVDYDKVERHSRLGPPSA